MDMLWLSISINRLLLPTLILETLSPLYLSLQIPHFSQLQLGRDSKYLKAHRWLTRHFLLWFCTRSTEIYTQMTSEESLGPQTLDFSSHGVMTSPLRWCLCTKLKTSYRSPSQETTRKLYLHSLAWTMNVFSLFHKMVPFCSGNGLMKSQKRLKSNWNLLSLNSKKDLRQAANLMSIRSKRQIKLWWVTSKKE